MTLDELARELIVAAPLHAPRKIEEGKVRVSDCLGVYAWFFDGLDTDWNRTCLDRDGHKLLYVGVATAGGKRQSLRRRIVQDHIRGNAEGSTLRRSLGAILGMPLLRYGRRKTFGEKESGLTEWIRQHGIVCWVETEEPEALERYLLDTLMPLNLKKNPRNEFRQELSALRRLQRAKPVFRPANTFAKASCHPKARARDLAASFFLRP